MNNTKHEWPLIGMTLDEAADALRVHRRTVQALILKRGLPARKVGYQWRIDPDAVRAWLASGSGLREDAEDTEE